MATKEQLSRIETAAEMVNDAKCEMISAIMDVDPSCSYESLNCMSIDELFDKCQSYL